MSLWPNSGHDLLILDVSRSHTTTFGRTPLDEWSARPWDLYLTKRNPQNRPTFLSLVGFDPTVSAGERPQTCALDRAATGIGRRPLYSLTFQPHIKYLIVNERMTSNCGDTGDNSMYCCVSCICILHLMFLFSVYLSQINPQWRHVQDELSFSSLMLWYETRKYSWQMMSRTC